MSDKKIDLIAQLLAKAESTTPEEAEALTEHAERLMIKYGIEQAAIDSRRAKAGEASEKIVEISLDFTGAYRLEFASLGAAVCKALGSLRCLQSTYKNKWARLYVIGFESDAKQAELLIKSLQVQSMVAVRAWWKLNKQDYSWQASYDQEAARRSFVRGFGRGAAERIAANLNQAVQEATTGTELVLLDRDAKVQDYVDSIPTVRSRARGGKGSGSALVGGYHAGQQASTGEKAVSQGRGISA